ncbi:MAG TPA: hypothetical protein VF691_00115 [Cytophagaceae bacterium]
MKKVFSTLEDYSTVILASQFLYYCVKDRNGKPTGPAKRGRGLGVDSLTPTSSSGTRLIFNN